MNQNIDEIYALISQSRYWRDFIPSKLEPLNDEELLLLSEMFYRAIEAANYDLEALDPKLQEELLREIRKLEPRVAAVDDYYINRENGEE